MCHTTRRASQLLMPSNQYGSLLLRRDCHCTAKLSPREILSASPNLLLPFPSPPFLSYPIPSIPFHSSYPSPLCLPCFPCPSRISVAFCPRIFQSALMNQSPPHLLTPSPLTPHPSPLSFARRPLSRSPRCPIFHSPNNPSSRPPQLAFPLYTFPEPEPVIPLDPPAIKVLRTLFLWRIDCP